MSTPVRFAGYAALFNRRDLGDDVILPGAFADGLKRLAGRRLPLLWQHDAGRRIGWIEHVSEDRRGLRVIGCIDGATGLPNDVAQGLRAGRIEGLSFGYNVRSARGEQPRQLAELDILEVSLVRQPMQPLARVHALA